MYFTLKCGKKLLILFVIVLTFAVGMTAAAPASAAVRRIPVYKVDTDEKKIALTFNCADGAEDVALILSILDKYNIKATFFPLGIWVNAHPDALRLIYEKGHEIGNHSFSHADCATLSGQEIYDEIVKCGETVKSVTGVTPVLFRCPSGSYDNKTVESAESAGMTVIQWSVDSVDWRNNPAQEIYDRVVNKTEAGDIIQFHTGTAGTADALEKIIIELKSRGFIFETVGSLIYSPPYTVDHAGVQHKTEASQAEN